MVRVDAQPDDMCENTSCSPETCDWLKWVLVTSIPLRRIDEDGQVVGRATGTLIDYVGRRFLLSVEHAVNRGSTGWAIELGYDLNRGMKVFHINTFAYVAEFTRSSGLLRELDLCLAEVPRSLESRYEYRTRLGLFDQRPHHVFQPDLYATPNPQGVFAFSGQVKPEQHAQATFVAEMVAYPNLKFLQSENELHIFQLPVPHPGHDAFRGCSGAPVVDMNRHVVELVTGGDVPSNTIHGVALQWCVPGLNHLLASDRGI